MALKGPPFPNPLWNAHWEAESGLLSSYHTCTASFHKNVLKTQLFSFASSWSRSTLTSGIGEPLFRFVLSGVWRRDQIYKLTFPEPYPILSYPILIKVSAFSLVYVGTISILVAGSWSSNIMWEGKETREERDRQPVLVVDPTHRVFRQQGEIHRLTSLISSLPFLFCPPSSSSLPFSSGLLWNLPE